MSAKYLRVRNWDKFQHYKKDGPVAWIKLHVKLMSDYEFDRETDATQLRIIKIWLLAAQNGGVLPNDKDWIRTRISARTLDLQHLISRGWLEELYTDSSLRREEKRREELPNIHGKTPKGTCPECRMKMPPGVVLEDHRRITHGIEDAA